MWNPETDTLKDPYIHPTDLARFLKYCQRPGRASYVHKIPVAYPTKANKDNWRKAFVGMQKRVNAVKAANWAGYENIKRGLDESVDAMLKAKMHAS